MNQKLKFELLWLCFTAVFIALVMSPIYLGIKTAYPFYLENILILLIAITFGRYLFFLKHHWICYSKWFKLFFVFFPIPVFLYLMDSFYEVQRFFDEEGIRSIMSDLSVRHQNQLAQYIKTEFIFFLAAAFIANFLLPFKMTRSIYRKKKKGVD